MVQSCPPLFAGISSEDCEKMFRCFGTRETSYEAGQIICEFGKTQQEVGVLLAGSAEVVRIDAEGNRTLLETLEEGGVFYAALSNVLGDSVYVRCCLSCRVVFLNYDQIMRRCENACTYHSVLVQNLFCLLTTKILRLNERVEVLSRRSIREKLLCYFEQQALNAGSRTFLLPFTFSALAEYISTDRSAMMRELGRLREEGLVSTEHRMISLA